MADPDTQASEAARSLNAARWGNRAVVRSAAVVIERAGELPADVRAELHAVTAPQPGHAQTEGESR